MKMSKEKISIILIAIIIIGSAGFYVMKKGGKKPTQKGITLTIITRHDTAIQMIFHDNFLKTELAKQYNIDKIPATLILDANKKNH